MREEIVTPPDSTGLPFRVLMAGISYCDGSYVIRRNHSSLSCLEYVIQGKGTVQEDKRVFEARQGDIYLLHEGKDHFYYSDEKEPWIKVWMNLKGEATEHLLSAYGLDRVNRIEGLDLKKEFLQFYEIACNGKTAREVSERCALLFHEILQKIYAQLREKGGKKDPTAQKIKEKIDSAQGWNISLDELSEELFFSKAHLIRVFRKEYQITPYEYILSRKLRLAKDLLTNTSLSIGQISSRLNFCDAHYFSNFFREKTGISPKEYRNRERK